MKGGQDLSWVYVTQHTPEKTILSRCCGSKESKGKRIEHLKAFKSITEVTNDELVS